MRIAAAAAATLATLALVSPAFGAAGAPQPVAPADGATVTSPAEQGAVLSVGVVVDAQALAQPTLLRVLVSRDPILDASGALADPVATQDLVTIPPGSPPTEHRAPISLPTFGKYAWQAVLLDSRGRIVTAGPGRLVTVTAASAPAATVPGSTAPAPAPALGPELRGGGTAQGFSGGLTDVVRQARPSVVRVTAVGASRVSVGSGFVVGPRLVGTNAHVIAGARRIRVTVGDGPGVVATVVAQDPAQDLALLRLPKAIKRPALRFAPSVRMGSEIVALGYPYGAGFRAAPGRVRDELTSKTAGSKSLRNLIETSAPLFPGSSGPGAGSRRPRGGHHRGGSARSDRWIGPKPGGNKLRGVRPERVPGLQAMDDRYGWRVPLGSRICSAPRQRGTPPVPGA